MNSRTMFRGVNELTISYKDFPPLPPPQLFTTPPQHRQVFNTKKKRSRGASSRPILSLSSSSTIALPHLHQGSPHNLNFDNMRKSSFPPDKSTKGSSRANTQVASHSRKAQDSHRNITGHRQSPVLSSKGSNLVPSSLNPRELSNSNIRSVTTSEAQTLNMPPRNTSDFQDRINTLLTTFHRDDEMSTDRKLEYEGHLRALVQEYNGQNRRLQESEERVVRERYQIVDELKIVRADLDVVTAERGSARRELHRLRGMVTELQSSAASEAQKLSRMQSNWQETHDNLTQQLSFQDEQLKGKRALWMDAHPGSSARRDAMSSTLRDPFSSPTTATKTGIDKGYLGNMESPPAASPLRSSVNQLQPYHTPAPISNARSSFGQTESSAQPSSQRGLRRRGNMQRQLALLPTLDMGSYTQSHQSFRTEPGTEVGSPGREDPPPVLPSVRADMVGWSDDVIAEYYQKQFSTLFAMVEGWVKTYCSQPNFNNDRTIASSSQELWNYMLNCAYPGQHADSHQHVTALLADARSRYWFVMRMIIAFCVKEALSLDVYSTYGAKTEADLADVKLRLQERGLATEARQKLIDEQARIIEGVLEADECAPWRNKVLNNITKRLRDMVGGLLNDGADRSRAGSDLGAIGLVAWKLSNDIHTSHLTFQIFFPETAAKFNASTMVCKEPTRFKPMELQIKQMRLKLVITPVVTLRDDRTTTIKAKSLHHATVLLMN